MEFRAGIVKTFGRAIRNRYSCIVRLKDLHREKTKKQHRGCHVRSTSFRLVLLVTCANLLGYMDRVCISVLVPKLRSELGFSAGDIGLIFGAFGLSYALFQMPWGMIVDRRG